MFWQAKPRCLAHYRAAVKRTVNTLPLVYLLPPYSGEIFNSLEDYCEGVGSGATTTKGQGEVCRTTSMVRQSQA
jgi:hypothetical protein